MTDDIKKVSAEMYLGKIKNIVKNRNIKLNDDEKVKYVDSKMIVMIKEVIFDENNEKNIKDTEIKKDYDINTLKTLVLYYVALYFDNLELLSKLLESGFFGEDEDMKYIDLYPLDKRLSSKFDVSTYIKLLNSHNSIFHYFYNSLSFNPKDKDSDNDALIKFAKIINTKPELLDAIEQSSDNDLCIENFLTKDNLSSLSTDIFINANRDQIRMLSYEFNDEYRKRIVNLIEKYNYNVDLDEWYRFFKLFTDEEIKNIDKDLSYDLINLMERLNWALFYTEKMKKHKVKRLYKKSINNKYSN